MILPLILKIVDWRVFIPNTFKGCRMDLTKEKSKLSGSLKWFSSPYLNYSSIKWFRPSCRIMYLSIVVTSSKSWKQSNFAVPLGRFGLERKILSRVDLEETMRGLTPQECNLGHKHWKIAPEAVPATQLAAHKMSSSKILFGTQVPYL